MTPSQRESCHIVIHSASAAAAAIGGGMAQLPVADSALLVPLQVTMIVSLGAVFDVHVTDSAAKGIALGMAGMYVGRAVTQVLVGWIPFVGNAINAATAGAITEAMGWAVAEKFSSGKIKGS